jgi:hypothetical protein
VLIALSVDMLSITSNILHIQSISRRPWIGHLRALKPPCCSAAPLLLTACGTWIDRGIVSVNQDGRVRYDGVATSTDNEQSLAADHGEVSISPDGERP